MLLAASADEVDRIVAYVADPPEQGFEVSEYTLDQLIERAKAELAARGR